MAKNNLDFRALIIEALMIVFAVTLALALNEWRSNIKERNTKAAVIENIVKELESNANDLRLKAPYHQEMSLKIGSYLESDSLWNTLTYNTAIEAMIKVMDKGIQNPDLQIGAWTSAQLSGVVTTLDYETLYMLSNVYRLQEDGPNNSWKQLAKLFADPNSYDTENTRKLFLMFHLGFQELAGQERSLIYLYEQTLKKLKKQ